MKITGLIWLEDIVGKLRQKHQVSQQEVKEVLESRPRFFFVEKGHRRGENVYAALGQAEGGRYLIVFFVHTRDSRALILSSRDMTDAERKRYARK